ncbi:MAG TPA: molybdopterin-dependent oxidoreductase, partial [Pyrinomonadaceae bacterium]|nr:molybdopterin-dependent oxidoreductase [Pyrinomonadaceae bacterium]
LAGGGDDAGAARKLGVEADALEGVRKLIGETKGTCVLMFGGELSAAAQGALAGLPAALGEAEGRRFVLHPLPLFNNSVGVHDLGLMNERTTPEQILDAAGEQIRALYVAGSFLPAHLAGREQALSKLDLLVVQELFHTETTEQADVVLPAASFAEVDGTFTNNNGYVQRVRASIPPVHQSKPDWLITSQLADALGVRFDFQMDVKNIFRELAASVPAYEGLRYPLLKDETKPVQAKHALNGAGGGNNVTEELRRAVAGLDETAEKLSGTPPVGHELFRVGTLTGKVPQFHLLAAGNPEPPDVLVSPLYQITLDAPLQRRTTAATTGD